MEINFFRKTPAETAQKALQRTQVADLHERREINEALDRGEKFLGQIAGKSERNQRQMLETVQSVVQSPFVAPRAAHECLIAGLQAVAAGTGGGVGATLAMIASQMKDKDVVSLLTLGITRHGTETEQALVHASSGDHEAAGVARNLAMKQIQEGAGEVIPALAKLGDSFNDQTHLGVANYIGVNQQILTQMALRSTSGHPVQQDVAALHRTRLPDDEANTPAILSDFRQRQSEIFTRNLPTDPPAP